MSFVPATARRAVDAVYMDMAAHMATLGGFRDTPEFRASGHAPAAGVRPVTSVPLTRAFGPQAEGAARYRSDFDAILRGDFGGDLNAKLDAVIQQLAIQRGGVLASDSGFPVRENLEAPATSLVPEDTPLRSRVKRTMGSGLASAWEQVTSLGGGWGNSYDQPGGGSAAQVFYAESGAPATLKTAYAKKSASYCRLGTIGGVSRFAMSAGATYQPQYETELMNQLRNLALLEEFALINGDSSNTAAPWGDGSTSYSWDGIITLLTTGNGVPSAQIQTGVGALTTAHIDGQLNNLYKNGGKGMFMLMNIQEARSITALAEAAGTFVRVTVAGQGDDAGKLVYGMYIGKYVHPSSGQQVDILRSLFVPAGTIVFGSDYGPDGRPAFDLDVLPQVEMPAMASSQQIQGYAAQPLAPTTSAPDMLNFLVSLYGVPRLKNAKVFAKSTGVTAVS